jgi:hypothetical protein
MFFFFHPEQWYSNKNPSSNVIHSSSVFVGWVGLQSRLLVFMYVCDSCECDYGSEGCQCNSIMLNTFYYWYSWQKKRSWYNKLHFPMFNWACARWLVSSSCSTAHLHSVTSFSAIPRNLQVVVGFLWFVIMWVCKLSGGCFETVI